MKRLGFLLIILVALGMARQAHSQPWGMGSQWWQDPSMSSQLNLTEDQKAKLQALHQALAAELNPLRDRLLTAKMEIRALWSQSQADRSRIAAKQQEILTLRTRMQELVTKYHADCQACLTPEQRQKLAAVPSGRGCKWCGPGRWGRGR
ncbi:MAG: Spy/CpxP family protein refolding chaperone [Desulfobaccales bacterium]